MRIAYLSLVIYRSSALPLLCTFLINLKRFLFQFIWSKPLMCRVIHHLCQFKGGRGVTNGKIRSHSLHHSYLGMIYVYHDETDDFWMEEMKKAFSILKRAHSNDGEMLCTHMQMHAEHNDTMKTTDSLLKKNILLTLFERFVCERELEAEQNCNILTPPPIMTISIVSFSFSRVTQPVARAPTQLGEGFLYRIWSPTGLVSKLTDFLSSPSFIIVQSPTQYLLNGMFDCHQAEITVMQFTGHFLPVHQSITVAWDFTLSDIVSQARLRDFFP